MLVRRSQRFSARPDSGFERAQPTTPGPAHGAAPNAGECCTTAGSVCANLLRPGCRGAVRGYCRYSSARPRRYRKWPGARGMGYTAAPAAAAQHGVNPHQPDHLIGRSRFGSLCYNPYVTLKKAMTILEQITERAYYIP